MERIKFYKSQIEQYKNQVKALKSKILRLSLIRLLVFLIASAGIYFLWSITLWVVVIIFVFIVSFVFFVKNHLKLKRALQKTKLLISINEDEILAIKGDFSHFKNGEKYKDSQHAFAEDIDLFGQSSFFQFINRTGLIHGEALLASWLEKQ